MTHEQAKEIADRLIEEVDQCNGARRWFDRSSLYSDKDKTDLTKALLTVEYSVFTEDVIETLADGFDDEITKVVEQHKLHIVHQILGRPF